MTEEGSGRLVIAAAAVVVLALLALVVVVVLGGEPRPADPEPPAPKVARVEPVRAAPRSVRVPLPAPAGRAHPDPAEEKPPVRLDPDTKLAMNRSVDEVLRSARAQCLDTWVASLSVPHAELVFDVVLHDGEVADLGLRSLDEPVPEDVVSCVADVMWGAEWPAFGELPGELRLQRSLALPFENAR